MAHDGRILKHEDRIEDLAKTVPEWVALVPAVLGRHAGQAPFDDGHLVDDNVIDQRRTAPP
jgi:hypothetical protein